MDNLEEAKVIVGIVQQIAPGRKGDVVRESVLLLSISIKGSGKSEFNG